MVDFLPHKKKMLKHLLYAPLTFFTGHPPQDTSDCANFFNELWICNANNITTDNDDWDLWNEMAYGVPAVPQQTMMLVFPSFASPVTAFIDWLYSPQQRAPLYVVDSLIDLEHPEFDGLRKRSESFNQGTTANYHGTHVASIAVGKTLGTSNRLISELVGVHVLGDDNSTPWSVVINALQWISKNPRGTINLSIAGPYNVAVNRAVESLVKHGYRVVTAAGNNGKDACDFSPGSSSATINVGALQREPPQTPQSGFSNHGKCVTLFARGETVLGAIPGNRLAYWSGTSMATPQVAGIWSGNYHMGKDRFLKQFSTVNSDFGGRRDLRKPE